MRSRYTAFSLGLSKYIIQTTHPLNNDYKENKSTWEQEILQFSNNFDFEKLTILEFLEPTLTHPNISYVTFTAQISLNGQDNSFTEKSKFEKIENRWLYLEGVQI